LHQAATAHSPANSVSWLLSREAYLGHSENLSVDGIVAEHLAQLLLFLDENPIYFALIHYLLAHFVRKRQNRQVIERLHLLEVVQLKTISTSLALHLGHA
jgi:hypothetical protein